jgi:hypothetical protein
VQIKILMIFYNLWKNSEQLTRKVEGSNGVLASQSGISNLPQHTHLKEFLKPTREVGFINIVKWNNLPKVPPSSVDSKIARRTHIKLLQHAQETVCNDDENEVLFIEVALDLSIYLRTTSNIYHLRTHWHNEPTLKSGFCYTMATGIVANEMHSITVLGIKTAQILN